MSLQNTEELYSSAKWTPKVGEQCKKCVSSPAWPDRALRIQVLCCKPGQKEPGQVRHSRTALWESGRLNQCTGENYQLWVSAWYKDLGTCTPTCTCTWGGKCCGRNPEFTAQKVPTHSKVNPLISNYVFCITVNISFNVCAQVALIYTHGEHSLFQMQMPCTCSIYIIQVIS